MKSISLKDHFINTVADELDHLNGTQFESLCRPFIEMLTDCEFELKGHNLEMKPVRGSVDLLQDGDCGVIGQCGTDKDYFWGDKAIKDIDGSLKNCPRFHTIYLFCNRRATGSELPDLEKAVEAKLGSLKRTHVEYKYHLYDSQRIARTILDNIDKTAKVKEILSVLDKSYEYYLCLPQSSNLPNQKWGYRHRPEEDEIEERLRVNDFIQIYGLSGMGKTEMSIAVANNIGDGFDSVLWLDEQSLQSGRLSDVRIKRMGESVNLAHLLSMFRVLVIIDNLNEDVEMLRTEFKDKSKKDSKCIVTSLQRNVAHEYAFNLKHLSDEISKDILNDCKVRPTDGQMTHMLANVAGYPLLLELSKKAVENGDMTWEEIVSISDLTGIDDYDKNMAFAERIVGRFKGRFMDMFNLLMGLSGTRLSKLFIREKNVMDYNSLLRYAIIEESDEFTCRIHSIVLSAIRTVMERDFYENVFLDYLDIYLSKHVFLRDVALYTFAAVHGDRLLALFNGNTLPDSLRKSILLTCVYSFDTYSDPQRYIELINTVELKPSESELDLRLLIERDELDDKIKKGETNDQMIREKRVNEYVGALDGIRTNSPKCEALKLHHMGKWLSNVKMYIEAESLLLKAVELNPESYHSHLRLARNFIEQKNPDTAACHLKSILGGPDLSHVPISVRLSAYEILGGNEYYALRSEFIDNRLEQFECDIYASLSDKNSHTYSTISRLANHLSYNFPEFFYRLCARLPSPLNIEYNEALRKDYGKIVCAQYLFGDYPEDYRKKLFRLAEEYLLSVKHDDFIRRDLIKLYLKAGVPDKAEPILGELNDSNAFNLQSMCKVWCAKGEFAKGHKCIDKALDMANDLKQMYRAAFHHDKAICLHGMADPKAEGVMKEAIALQPNEKTKEEWRVELAAWYPDL